MSREVDDTKTPAKGANAPFRLHKAIMAALSDTHRLVEELSESLPNTELFHRTIEEQVAPPELGIEEISRFHRALNAYADQWAESTARFVLPPIQGPYRRPSARGTWGISGGIDLRFTRDDGLAEIRKITLGSPPPDPSPRIGDIIRFSLIGAPGILSLLYVSPDAGSSGVHLREQHITDDHISEARSRVRSVVDAAFDVVEASAAAGTTIDESHLAEAGWWCNQCAYVRHCPAIAQPSMSDLIAGYPA